MTFNKKLEPVKISNYFKYWKLDNLKIEGNDDNSHNNGLPQKNCCFSNRMLKFFEIVSNDLRSESKTLGI